MSKLPVLPKTRHSLPNDSESASPHIGKRLRVLRIAKRLSQAELGKVIGVSFQQIQKYERGINHISAANLYHISQALSISPAYFFEGLGESSDTLETDVASTVNLHITGLLRSLLAIKSTTRRELILSSLQVILENVEE